MLQLVRLVEKINKYSKGIPVSSLHGLGAKCFLGKRFCRDRFVTANLIGWRGSAMRHQRLHIQNVQAGAHGGGPGQHAISYSC